MQDRIYVGRDPTPHTTVCVTWLDSRDLLDATVSRPLMMIMQGWERREPQHTMCCSSWIT